MTQVRLLTSVRRIKTIVYYEIVIPSEVIKKSSDGTLTPCDFELKVRKKSANEVSYITSTAAMTEASLFIQYSSISNNNYVTFPITDTINADMIGDGIKFRLMAGNVVLDEKTMTVVSDGVVGPAGITGRMPYPCGFWLRTATYVATDSITPIVYYEAGKTYYVMNKTIAVRGVDPANDYAANGSNAIWIPFENYIAIYTELLMANFGKLASAIFYGNYMFSQYGIDENNNETSDYSGFADGTFSPNILLDFLTGKSKLKDTDIEGTIRSRAQYVIHRTFAGNDDNYYLNPTKASDFYNSPPSRFRSYYMLPDPAEFDNLKISITMASSATTSPLGSISFVTTGNFNKMISGVMANCASPDYCDGKFEFLSINGAWVVVSSRTFTYEVRTDIESRVYEEPI